MKRGPHYLIYSFSSFCTSTPNILEVCCMLYVVFVLLCICMLYVVCCAVVRCCRVASVDGSGSGTCRC